MENKNVFKCSFKFYSETWVITDGTKRGISGIASGAVKDFIQAYGEGQVEAIGIVPWKFISDNKIFVPDDYSVS